MDDLVQPNTDKAPETDNDVEVKNVSYNDAHVLKRVLGNLQQQMKRDLNDSLLHRLSVLVVYTTSVQCILRCAVLISKHGPSVLLPLLILMCFIGVPAVYLEASYYCVALGQFTSLDAITLYSRMAPIASGLGWSMLALSYLDMLRQLLMASVHSNMAFHSLSMVSRDDSVLSRCLFDVNGECIDASVVCGNEDYKNEGEFYSQQNSQCVRGMMTLRDPYLRSLNTRSIMILIHGFPTIRRASDTMAIDLYLSNTLTNFGGDATGANSYAFNLCGIIVTIIICCYTRGPLRKLQKVCAFVLLVAAFHTIVNHIVTLTTDLTVPYMFPKAVEWSNYAMWMDCMICVIVALKIGQGTLVTMGSWNKFSNNCLKDVIIVCAISTMLPFMMGYNIERVWRKFTERQVDQNTYDDHVQNFEGDANDDMSYSKMLSSVAASAVFGEYELPMILKNALFTIAYNSGLIIIINRSVVTMLMERMSILEQFEYNVLANAVNLSVLLGFFSLNATYHLEFANIMSTIFLRAVPVIVIAQIVVVLFVYGANKLFVDINTMMFPPSKHRHRISRMKKMAFNLYMFGCWIAIPPVMIWLLFYVEENFHREWYTTNGEGDFHDSHDRVSWFIILLPIPVMAAYKIIRAKINHRGGVSRVVHPDILYGPRDHRYRIIVTAEHCKRG